jgi:hypothetical protein
MTNHDDELMTETMRLYRVSEILKEAKNALIALDYRELATKADDLFKRTEEQRRRLIEEKKTMTVRETVEKHGIRITESSDLIDSITGKRLWSEEAVGKEQTLLQEMEY